MKTLHEIASTSETAEAAILFLSMRSRFRSEPMRISRFTKALKMAGIKVVRHELHQMFRDLEEAGEGKLNISRTLPYSFEWRRDFIQVANEALNKENKIIQIRTKAKPVVQRPVKTIETHTVIFILPSGGQVKIEAPKGLKSSDLANLASNLKSLTG